MKTIIIAVLLPVVVYMMFALILWWQTAVGRHKALGMAPLLHILTSVRFLALTGILEVLLFFRR